MATITSRQHTVVKEYRRVARGDARYALLDGWHLLEEAMASHLRVASVALLPDSITPALERVMSNIQQSGATIYPVSRNVLDALSPVRTPSGVVALVERRPSTVQDLLSPSPALVVMAVDMQDPGNVGAVIRSAEAGGATGVALAGASAEAWGWKALRAAMGSTFRLPVVPAGDAASLIEELESAGVTVLASVPRGGTSMYDAEMRHATAIIIGGEGPGLPSPLIASAHGRVTIPMRPRVESLNAAVTAALLVFEARRQREVRS